MIDQATVSDAGIVGQLASQMWPSHTDDELTADFGQIISCKDAAVFLLKLDNQ